MAGILLGKTAIVTNDDIPANTDQAVATIGVSSNCADFSFIYYYPNRYVLIHYINNCSAQSAQPNINLKQIGNLPIYLPSFSIQKKIAAIFSCLDDKIELNNRMNSNLEQQAQAIFRKWFVDSENRNGKKVSWMIYATIAKDVSVFRYSGFELLYFYRKPAVK